MEMVLKRLHGKRGADITGGEQVFAHHDADILSQLMAFCRNNTGGHGNTEPENIPGFQGTKEHFYSYLIGQVANKSAD